MIWFTADCHFGHKNIIRSCGRPFGSMEEMDETMLRLWRERVKEEDEIYILGDLMFYCPDPEKYLGRLPGRKHLILGNHDSVWMKKTVPAFHFESISHMEVLRLSGVHVTLCHYPMMCWEDSREEGILIYGHIHNNRQDPFWPMLSQMERAYNAGVDINGFQPVSLEELVENNKKYLMQK